MGVVASWRQLADALDRLETKEKKPEPKGPAGRIGSWFQNLTGGGPKKPPHATDADDANRARLFGGDAVSSSDKPQKRQDPKAHQVNHKANAAACDLEGLKQGFNERGEKLSRLNDKAEELENAAQEFEKMCTKLNREAAGRSWW